MVAAAEKDGKAAGALHDRFNMFAVTPLVVMTLLSLVSPSAWNQALLSWSTFAYVAVDIVYNAIVPECQPNTTRWLTIMLHHFVTLWLVYHPCMHPANADMTAKCTVVEVNTLILTLNRELKWKSLTYAFYATWVSMRLVWYPYLIFHFHERITSFGAKPFDYTYCQTVVAVVVLCALNWLWTFEVVAKLAQPKQPKAKPKKTAD
jgi:hypothetical protein